MPRRCPSTIFVLMVCAFSTDENLALIFKP
jgi:hypothetical protein